MFEFENKDRAPAAYTNIREDSESLMFSKSKLQKTKVMVEAPGTAPGSATSITNRHLLS